VSKSEAIQALGGLLESPKIVVSVFAISCWLVVNLIVHLGGVEAAELALHDRLIAWRATGQKCSDQIVVVGITEADIQRYGWPLSDQLLADSITKLLSAGASVVGVDLYRDLPVGVGAEQLKKVLSEQSAVIGVEKFPDGEGNGVAPPPALANTERFGFSDMVMDSDGVVRRGLLYAFHEDRVGVSLALRIAALALQPAQIALGAAEDGSPRLGAATFTPIEADFGAYVDADSSGYQFPLTLAGKGGDYRRISLGELLESPTDRLQLSGKIVLVGVTSQSVNDSFMVPTADIVQPLRPMFGVVLHAQIVDQLQRLAMGREHLLGTLGHAEESLLLLLACIAGAFAGLSKARWRVVGLCLVPATVVGVGVAFRFAIWIPGVAPVAGLILAAVTVTAFRAAREQADRKVLMELFGRQVSPSVAEHIWAQRQQLLERGRLRSERLNVTVLFSDLVGFTTLSETLEPEALFARINEYMQTMTSAIIEHEGMVEKYMGDGIMALFGAPVARLTAAEVSSDAANAVDAALAMGTRLESLNRKWQSEGLPPVAMRIGIQSGPVVSGSLGNHSRFEFTVLGDTVNTAARLESFDKNYNPDQSVCRVLVGSHTRELLGSRFELESAGHFELKGKAVAVEIFRIIGRSPQKQNREMDVGK
jgi:adenylate cyclase